MIISKTPLRISFLGGGTDLKDFYQFDEGKVISSSIDKYLYVMVRKQSNLGYKYRINWSKIEFTNKIDKIKHPIVKEAFKLLNINFPCEVSTFSDIPAQTGMGSSSTFTVGLLNALYTLKKIKISKKLLAEQAAKIEVDILKRNIGRQDHYIASYGGFNLISFKQNFKIKVEKIKISKKNKDILFKNILLFFTGQTRNASKILKKQKSLIHKNFNNLRQMKTLTIESKKLLEKGKIKEFGLLIDKNWQIKKTLSNKITNLRIEKYYNQGKNHGAIGGKVLGAGGGGFLCFYVEKKFQNKLINKLNNLEFLKVNSESSGSKIIFKDI
tara:strand:- start:126 stop:1103 length:978 start_codon:yes stop_codon:yes gene_type:complete